MSEPKKQLSLILEDEMLSGIHTIKFILQHHIIIYIVCIIFFNYKYVKKDINNIYIYIIYNNKNVNF